MSRFESIEDCAANWVVREEEGLDAAGRAALEAWLDESDLHRVIYLRLRHGWKQADRLVALKAPVAYWRRPARRWGGFIDLHLLAASLLAVFVLGGLGYRYLVPHGGYTTSVGEQRTIRLADGTQVELNTNTRLHVEITPKHRLVVLEHGEAYFEVFHDPKRPFVVRAADRQIIDIGTKFSVRRDGDQVNVLVAEGEVRVEAPESKHAASSVLVKANDAVIAKAGETLVMKKARHAVDETLSWRSGVLVFDQQTLADAAAQFSRYSNKQIIVKGEARNLRIGGSFRINNVSAFASLIREGFGLNVTEDDNTIVISN
jgi:transmembrane sensor